MNFLNKPAIVFFHLFCLGILGFFDTKPISAQEPTTELYVRTTPAGAKVFMDGKELGVTPDLFDVEPGTVKIVVKLEGYDPIEKELEIRASRVTKLELEFKKAGQAMEQDRGTNRGGRKIFGGPSDIKDSDASASNKAAIDEVLNLVDKAKRHAKDGSLLEARVTLDKAHGLAVNLKGVDLTDFGPKELALQEIVRAYVVLKDFQSALSTAKEIRWNQDRKQQAFLDVVMGAVQAGETETAIDYFNQIKKEHSCDLTELFPSKTKKLKELLTQEAKRSPSRTPSPGKSPITPSKDSEASASEKAVFVQVLKLVEKAKQEAKEGSLIDARATLEDAQALTTNLEVKNMSYDCTKYRALQEIVRAYVSLKDFPGAFVTAQKIYYYDRQRLAMREVILGALSAGENEVASHYYEEFKDQFSENQKNEIEKLLGKAMPDKDGKIYGEVMKLVAEAKKQAKQENLVDATSTLQKAHDLTGNLKVPTNKLFFPTPDCLKYKALQEIERAYLVLNDFQSALATAKEIQYQDRRREALYEVIMGTARAGEIDTALRYLDQEGLILKELPPTEAEKLRQLLDKETIRARGRATSQVKATLPRNEKKAEENRKNGNSGGECFIDSIEVGPDSGELFTGEMDGKVTTVTCSGAAIAGVFTHFSGTQTVLFRNGRGDTFRCPGTFYFALANIFGSADSRSGGVDWAFVIPRSTTVPDWVQTFTKQNLITYKNNTFLTPGKSFTGSQHMGTNPKDPTGPLVEIQPKPGQEFGENKILLLVGKMKKAANGWTIATD